MTTDNTHWSCDMPADNKTDYSTLIDSQTREFIVKTDNWYPPDTLDFSLQKQRENYNAMCREFHHGYPEGVQATDDNVPSASGDIPIRRYQTESGSKPVRLIYFHGGGFIVGGLESHDDVCAELCDKTRLPVTAVDYRLAPEHPHPAAFNDSLAAVLHECKLYRQHAILCGDSAGGNLAAAVSHHLRDHPAPDVLVKGQVLIYPGLGGHMDSGSYITHADAPMLTTRDVRFYASIRTAYKPIDNIVTLSPLEDRDFSMLPPTVVYSAQCDPLCDDGRHYCEAIVKQGGTAQWICETGLVHGYLRARHSVDRARESFDRMVQSVVELART